MPDAGLTFVPLVKVTTKYEYVLYVLFAPSGTVYVVVPLPGATVLTRVQPAGKALYLPSAPSTSYI